MNKINITGIIGIDTRYEEIVSQLDNHNGDIEISINSAGGYVYDGIGIYNAIKKYNKGKKIINICGLSASISSYIMLAGDELNLEENAVIMIHNPSIFVMGDHRKLRTAYIHIEKLKNLMSEAYSKHTGIAKDEIEVMMDNETFFIGNKELKTWGKVIEPIEKDSNKTKLTKAEANIQIQAMCSLVEKGSKEAINQTDKLVALLENQEEIPIKDNRYNKDNKKQSPQTSINNYQSSITNYELPTNKKETKMENKLENIKTLEDFKNLFPQLYNEAKQQGMAEEKSRVNAHLEFIDIAPEIALNSIKNDVLFLNNSEIQAKYIKAKINKEEIITMEKDNNPEVIQKPIQEASELKNEIEKTNAEAEEKIRSFMPHLTASR